MKCSGQCSKCGSENIEWGNEENDGEMIGYEWECNDCGAEGTDWYELVYVETTVNE